MDTETMPLKRVHHGRNVRRFREMKGMKQEVLAEELNISQSAMSRYEQKEEIEDEILEKIAIALNVPMDSLKNYNDEATAYYINTFNNSDEAIGIIHQPACCTFNPIDKIVEFYERMLKAEQERNMLLEQMLKGKK